MPPLTSYLEPKYWNGTALGLLGIPQRKNGRSRHLLNNRQDSVKPAFE